MANPSYTHRMKKYFLRLVSNPIVHVNVLLVGYLIVIGQVHNNYHHDMTKDADAFVYNWCRENSPACKEF